MSHLLKALFAAVMLCLPVAFADGPKTAEKPKLPDTDTLVGWGVQEFSPRVARVRSNGFIEIFGFDDAKAGDLNTFFHVKPASGMFDKVPSPANDFGVVVVAPAGKPAEFKASDLDKLAGMEHLTMLTLKNVRLPAGAFKALAKNKALQHLFLVDAGLTDASLEGIASMTQLRGLSLNENADLTDDAAKVLARLSELRFLSLGHTKVTGVKNLIPLAKLEYLFLSYTPTVDAGLKQVGQFAQLRGLFLSGSKVTDAGLKSVAKLEHLRDLGLFKTAIGDAGLKDLSGLNSLRVLDIGETKVSNAGVRELGKKLPELNVQR